MFHADNSARQRSNEMVALAGLASGYIGPKLADHMREEKLMVALIKQTAVLLLQFIAYLKNRMSKPPDFPCILLKAWLPLTRVQIYVMYFSFVDDTCSHVMARHVRRTYAK